MKEAECWPHQLIVEIMPFYTGVVISFIYLAVVNDLMAMQMAMHIA
jgi:hypothetical protein